MKTPGLYQFPKLRNTTTTIATIATTTTTTTSTITITTNRVPPTSPPLLLLKLEVHNYASYYVGSTLLFKSIRKCQ